MVYHGDTHVFNGSYSWLLSSSVDLLYTCEKSRNSLLKLRLMHDTIHLMDGNQIKPEISREPCSWIVYLPPRCFAVAWLHYKQPGNMMKHVIIVFWKVGFGSENWLVEISSGRKVSSLQAKPPDAMNLKFWKCMSCMDATVNWCGGPRSHFLCSMADICRRVSEGRYKMQE